MDLVAGIDPLRALAAEEILIEFQTTELFQNGNAIFLRTAGINGALVDHDGSRFKRLANGLAGFDEGRQVRPVVLINRGWDRDDKEVGLFYVVDIVRE